jgi:AAA family ATPase
MIFKDVSCRGFKRTFLLHSVNGSHTGQAKYQETSSVCIASAVGENATTQVNGSRPQLQVVDVAGIDQALKKLNRFLSNFDRKFKSTFGDRSCSVLLHGGHGTGKTFLIDKIIATGWGRVCRIHRSTKVAAVRNTFRDAMMNQPSIIVLDDLEKMVSKEDSVSEDFVEALGEEMDNLVNGTLESLPRVLVIAATLNLSSIPISLRGERRFSTDIILPVPDATSRKAILRSFSIPTHPDKYDEIVHRLGDRTHAYTAKDLRSLLNTARDLAEEKDDQYEKFHGSEKEESSTQVEQFLISEADIEQALLLVRPTAMHDVTLRPPSVRWDEIGGQESVKKALRRAVETPLLVSRLFYISIVSIDS